MWIFVVIVVVVLICLVGWRLRKRSDSGGYGSKGHESYDWRPFSNDKTRTSSGSSTSSARTTSANSANSSASASVSDSASISSKSERSSSVSTPKFEAHISQVVNEHFSSSVQTGKQKHTSSSGKPQADKVGSANSGAAKPEGSVKPTPQVTASTQKPSAGTKERAVSSHSTECISMFTSTSADLAEKLKTAKASSSNAGAAKPEGSVKPTPQVTASTQKPSAGTKERAVASPSPSHECISKFTSTKDLLKPEPVESKVERASTASSTRSDSRAKPLQLRKRSDSGGYGSKGHESYDWRPFSNDKTRTSSGSSTSSARTTSANSANSSASASVSDSASISSKSERSSSVSTPKFEAHISQVVNEHFSSSVQTGKQKHTSSSGKPQADKVGSANSGAAKPEGSVKPTPQVTASTQKPSAGTKERAVSSPSPSHECISKFTSTKDLLKLEPIESKVERASTASSTRSDSRAKPLQPASAAPASKKAYTPDQSSIFGLHKPASVAPVSTPVSAPSPIQASAQAPVSAPVPVPTPTVLSQAPTQDWYAGAVHTTTLPLGSASSEIDNRLKQTPPPVIKSVKVKLLPDYADANWYLKSFANFGGKKGDVDGLYSYLRGGVQTMLDVGLWSIDMLKPEWETYLALLASNNVTALYHFTARCNVDIIKQARGLVSWYSADQMGMYIPFAGGDAKSRELDVLYNNADYVHLSFCDDHPMAYHLRNQGTVLLEISPVVAVLSSTLFSDINAADRLHKQGPNFSDLQMVNFAATKMHYVSRTSEFFKPHQAEVMVYRCVPACLIHNLDFL